MEYHMHICAYFVVNERGVMEKFVKPFKALSDETRLRILSIVVQRECCVCEVMQVLDISQSRASRNLGILEEAGFLKSRRSGAWVYYSLRDDPGTNFAAALAKMTGDFSMRYPIFRKDRTRLKNAMPIGLVCGEEPCPKDKPKKNKKDK